MCPSPVRAGSKHCLLWVSVWLCLLCTLWSPMAQAAELVVRLSHVVAPDTPKGLMAARFQQLVAQASEGRIRVDVYPDSQLYGDDDEMDAPPVI